MKFSTRRVWHLLTAVAVLATAAVAVLPGTAGSASAASSHPAYITLLVGSPRLAVFEYTVDPNTGTIPPTSAPYQLVVRSSAGHFYRYPLTAAQKSLDSLRWSLSGNILTAIDAADHKTVDWWNLASRASGTLTIPKGSYVAADPNGVLYMTKGGVLTEMTTAGATSAISHPFTKRPSHMTGRSSDTGVVISDFPGRARYLTFADPTTVHKLKTGSKDIVVCGALSKKFAACTTFGALEGRPSKAALVPLNGKSPIFAHDGEENFGQVGLIGAATLAWTRFHAGHGTRSHGPDSTVASLLHRSGESRVAKGANVAFGQMITAFGKVLVMSRDRHSVLATRHGKRFTRVATAPVS